MNNPCDYSNCNYFTYKGYGRIYVKHKSDIERVEQIIKNLDSHEYTYYYPQSLVVSIDYYPNVVYIGKFDLHKDFYDKCKEADIPIFIFDSEFESWPKGYFPNKPLTKEEIIDFM